MKATAIGKLDYHTAGGAFDNLRKTETENSTKDENPSDFECQGDQCQAAKSCYDRFNLKNIMNPIFKQDNLSLNNANNQTIYTDSTSEDETRPRFVALNINAKNINNSEVILNAPNTYYCVSIEAQNMNNFTYTTLDGTEDNLRIID